MDAQVLEQVMPFIRGQASRMCRGNARLGVEFDDLCQVASLAVLKKMPSYDPILPPLTFFYQRICGAMIDEIRRLALDKKRTSRIGQRSEQILAINEVSALRIRKAEAVNRNYSRGETITEGGGERIASFARSIGVAMTERERAILEKRYDGMAHRRIGKALALAESTVANVVASLHNRIREALVSQGRDWRTAFA